jgi:hypothetical protein
VLAPDPLVTRSTLVVGIQNRCAADVRAKSVEFLDWSNIERVEPLPLTPSAA